MGVSTSPVTRAVERLEENGLVTAVRSSDSKYRSYFVFDLSSESLEDLFVARRAIEGEAAFLCAGLCEGSGYRPHRLRAG